MAKYKLLCWVFKAFATSRQLTIKFAILSVLQKTLNQKKQLLVA